MGGAINFLLNGEARSVADVAPTVTALQYLREIEHKVGTKEGCAEGDCGACTIVLGRLERGRLVYRAVNSCLVMLPQLDGAAVLTVEGLAGPDGELHPVQQALLEADATQCGFCTPGFVMAMFALHQEGQPGNDEVIHESLAGNLCRCTGYRSIVEACRRLAADTAGKGDRTVSDSSPALAALPASQAYGTGGQIFLAPGSLAELADAAIQYPDAKLLGGGTDLGLLVSKERKPLPVLISTSRVPELKRIGVAADAIELGGAVTYSEALPCLDEHFPSFGALVRRIGSRQIRNLGTFAGNLATASPIGDTLPCLMALDATVTLRAKSGTRTMPVETFITGYRRTALLPGEYIETIRIPRLRPAQRFIVYKLSKRFDQDISTVVGAFRIRAQDSVAEDFSAVFGGMAGRAARAARLEAALTGKPWIPQSLPGIEAEIAADFAPLTDHRGSTAYRLRAATNLVRRLQLETTIDVPVRLEEL